MKFRCRKVELFRFRESGNFGSSSSLIANEGSEDQQIITITGPGIKFMPGEEYKLNLINDDGFDWQTFPDRTPEELGYTNV